MTNNKKLLIVGVRHGYPDPDYKKVLNYILKIKPDKRVSIENPRTLEEVLDVSDQECSTKFCRGIAKRLLKRGAEVKTVEDFELWYEQWLLNHEPVITSNLKYAELFKDSYYSLNILRSVEIYKQSVENKSDILITGCWHAHDMEQLNKPAKFKYISKLSDEKKLLANEYIQKYLKGEITREKILEQVMKLYRRPET